VYNIWKWNKKKTDFGYYLFNWSIENLSCLFNNKSITL